MAKSRNFDVWVTASNTVYKNVPFNIVTDWAQQGRLGAADKLRPAGSDAAWTTVASDPIVSDFLFVKSPKKAVTTVTTPAPVSAGEEAHGDVWMHPKEPEDDDIDMIPLIDISLVLLIFFMMTSATGALSPIDVPQMKNAFDTKSVSDAFTIAIDRRPNGDVMYSLRIGDKAADKDDDNLDNLNLLIVRLDARLKETLDKGGAPPEARIACHKELPSERVHELVKELQTRKDAGKIAVYHAEVNERGK
ncbi:hypothetical protein BH11PLA2_BH11PLA2_37390 [soil metagenome]